MQIDFYQLGRDPVEHVVPLLADKALESGARVTILCADPGQRETLSQALWAREDAFLAHGDRDKPHADRQPIILADSCTTTNGATFGIIADGDWREDAENYERAILLFAIERTEPARVLWKSLKGSGHTLRFFAQDGQGRWKLKG